MIEIDTFLQKLNTSIVQEKLVVSSIKIPQHENGGVHVQIDGAHYLTNISIWQNGCFDVDYVSLASEKYTFNHCEFTSTDAAIEAFLHEVRLGIERNKSI
jgi:hypothetical protein